jgi:hypothetical protein
MGEPEVRKFPPWSQRTTWDTVCKRVAGRAKYNAVRRFKAELRRGEVLQLLHAWGWRHGVQVRIAEALRVSESTISRDLALILPLYTECEHCRSPVPRHWADEA